MLRESRIVSILKGSNLIRSSESRVQASRQEMIADLQDMSKVWLNDYLSMH
jgi:hypothetical protein